MSSIRVVKPFDGHAEGDVISVPFDKGRMLVGVGLARYLTDPEPAPATEPPAPPAGEEPKPERPRGRRRSNHNTGDAG